MTIRRLAFISFVALGVLAGCSGGDKPADGGSEGTTGSAVNKPAEGSKKWKLAFVTNNASDFWTIARKGVEKAVEDSKGGFEVDFQMPQDGTAAGQKQIIDGLLAKGVDGIAVSPNDPANSTAYLNEVAGKTLLVTQDSDAPESNRVCYIGTNNVEAGKQAGEAIKAALPNGGKVVAFVGKKDAQNAKERIQGIEEALKGSNCQLIDVRTDDTDHAKAKSNASDVLVKTPDVACLVGIWSYNGPGIYEAVKDANKIGKVKIVCFDEEDQTLAGVKEGAIDATVVQQPYEFGYQSVTRMAKFLGGDKSVFPENKIEIVPTLLITKDKVDEFKAKLDKLRGR